MPGGAAPTTLCLLPVADGGARATRGWTGARRPPARGGFDPERGGVGMALDPVGPRPGIGAPSFAVDDELGSVASSKGIERIVLIGADAPLEAEGEGPAVPLLAASLTFPATGGGLGMASDAADCGRDSGREPERLLARERRW